MKKAISFLITIVCCLSMTITAFAAENFTVNETNSGIVATISDVARDNNGGYIPTYVDVSVNSGRKITSVNIFGVDYQIGRKECTGATTLNTDKVSILFDSDLQFENKIPTIKITTDGKETTEINVSIHEEDGESSKVLFTGTKKISITPTTKAPTTRKPVTTVKATNPTAPAKTDSTKTDTTATTASVSTTQTTETTTETAPINNVNEIVTEPTVPQKTEADTTADIGAEQQADGKENNGTYTALIAVVVLIGIFGVIILLGRKRKEDQTVEATKNVEENDAEPEKVNDEASNEVAEEIEEIGDTDDTNENETKDEEV